LHEAGSREEVFVLAERPSKVGNDDCGRPCVIRIAVCVFTKFTSGTTVMVVSSAPSKTTVRHRRTLTP